MGFLLRFLRTKTRLAQLPQRPPSPLLTATLAATWWMFSAACLKTPLLNTRLICLTSTVKYAQVIQVHGSMMLLCLLQCFYFLIHASKMCLLGQKTEDELASKKARVSSKPDVKPPRHESRSSRSGDSPSVNAAAYPPLDPLSSHPPVAPPYHSNAGPVVPETPPQLYQEDPNTMVPPAPTLPLVTPAVSSVSISRRDPRMARHGSAASVVPPAIEKPASNAAEPVLAPITASVAAPMDSGVKVPLPLPLPLPPAPPPLVATSKSTKKRCSVFLLQYYQE